DTSQAFAVRQQFTRLRINIGTTDAGGNFAGAIPAVQAGTIGQMFSAGTEMYTVVNLSPAPVLSTGTGAPAFDTTTGAFTLIGAPPLAIVYYYPTWPVMALATYQQLA